jgi:hypothetical protein
MLDMTLAMGMQGWSNVDWATEWFYKECQQCLSGTVVPVHTLA